MILLQIIMFFLQTLYTYPKNFRAYKVLIAAKLSGNKVTVDPAFEFGKTNQTDEFLKKFPLGKVPAYESSKGECIFDSNAIAYAVSSDAIRGKTPLAQSQVLMWIQFAGVFHVIWFEAYIYSLLKKARYPSCAACLMD